MQPSVNTNEGTFTPDNLFGGSFPIVTDQVTIASGAGKLGRGTVLGQVTATGKYKMSAADDGGTPDPTPIEDGSEVPIAILAEDVDATSSDQAATAYLTGEFNVRKLVYGSGHTAASVKAALRKVGIFVKDTVGA